MGVVIEAEIWEPNKAIFIFLFISCILSILCLPSKTAGNVFNHGPPHSFLYFQRNFLLLFSLSSVIEGLRAVFGEYELAYSGFWKEEILLALSGGLMVSLFIGSFLGMLSDLIGHKRLCLLFYILHLIVSILKGIIGTPVIWFASLCLSLASSVFSFSFETWMVIEFEKLGQRQDSLNDMFWLMAFFESASFIGSQFLGNYLTYGDVIKHMSSIWNGAVILAVVAIIFVIFGWKESPQTAASKDYRLSFSQHILGDKRIWLLSWAQACIHFSITTFWILWAPLIVADGRGVSLGLIYPCLMGSRMLGSTGFPWFLHGSSPLRPEEYLIYAFVIMGIALSISAYDYQEIGVLVGLFCVFHTCVGVVLPFLARLRTMYVPNEVRGGMISLSLMPANAAILFFLFLRGYYQSIGNSTVIAFSAIGLFSAAGCMYALKKWGNQIHPRRRKL